MTSQASALPSTRERADNVVEPSKCYEAAVKALETVAEAYKEEERKLAFAKKTVGREKAFIDKHFPLDDRIAFLNVSGQPIATHGATFRAFEDSMLGALFGKKDWTVQDKDLDGDKNYCIADSIDLATFEKVGNECHLFHDAILTGFSFMNHRAYIRCLIFFVFASYIAWRSVNFKLKNGKRRPFHLSSNISFQVM